MGNSDDKFDHTGGAQYTFEGDFIFDRNQQE